MMKPAVALFAGIFASGLALASFVEPIANKVSCKSFYSFVSNKSEVIEFEGPTITDLNSDNDGHHQQVFTDETLGLTLSFDWDEASNFRDLHAKIQVRSASGLLEAATFGKPSTAVHLDDLSIPVSKGNLTALQSVSLYCGITQQP